jgi:NAD(P)-dependent dehydrogenase (short-subunit alcohol dehydrogenase family)
VANLILVTGAAGRVGGIGRAVTELLLQQGKAVRAMVRNEDERAQTLRDMGAEVAVGNLLDLKSLSRTSRLLPFEPVHLALRRTLLQSRPAAARISTLNVVSA